MMRNDATNDATIEMQNQCQSGGTAPADNEALGDREMSILLVGALSPEEYAEWRHHLALHLPDEALVLGIEAYDRHAVEIALVANPEPGLLARHPNLAFIQSLWAGVDRLLSDPLLPSGVPVARLVDPNLTQSMVECVLATVLVLHRQMPAYARQQARGLWRQLPQPVAAMRRVGLLGLGQLGRAAGLALAAIGFSVCGWSRNTHEVAGVTCLSGADGLPWLLERTDILVNLLPLTRDTEGILGRETFAHLPPGAAVVNLARGGHLVEQDLLDALAEGMLGHAILDVFREEPLPSAHPFWRHPKITVFPHVAAYSEPGTAAGIAAENVAAFRAGRPLRATVDRHAGY
jgi:glyoxylate/hydroxypyruvate reductase A